MNPKSGRTIPLYFKVSPEEKELIDKKMEQLGTHNQRVILSILVYTFFSRMFDLMLPPVVKHSIAVV